MAQKDVLDYIRQTPHNSNVNVVKGMLNGLDDGSGSGSSDEGSNDFTIAVMTIINETTDYVTLYGGFAIDGEGGDPNIMYPEIVAEPETTVDYNAVLYKGSAAIEILDNVDVTTEGDVEYDNGVAIVTGDCSMTIIKGL